MVINQLFISKPPIELVTKLINAFGIKNINDSSEFSYIDMNINRNSNSPGSEPISIISNLQKELSEYYIPCKRKIYFDMSGNSGNSGNIDNIEQSKSLITILRQLLKLYNYNLSSREGYINGIKNMIYKIVVNTKVKKIRKKRLPRKEFVINFD
jgi:hypothetical protein